MQAKGLDEPALCNILIMERGVDLSYLLKRILFLMTTLWAAVTVNFIIPRMMPGNPAQAMIAKFSRKGEINPESLNAIKLMMGLHDESWWIEYIHYLNKVIHFNFGISYSYFPYTVTQVIGEALPWTLALVGITTVISFFLSTGLGVITGWKRGSKTDSALTIISTFTSAFPYFWFALIAVYVLGFILDWFPQDAGYSITTIPGWNGPFITSVLYHGFLPAVTILISSMGSFLLTMRNNILNTLSEDYVLLAKAKGLKNAWIATMYVARNAILPNITGFAISLGFVVGGSLLTEVVFSYPGLGYLLFNSVTNQDYPLMQGLFLITVVCVVLANFLADIAYMFLDPRIRKEREG